MTNLDSIGAGKPDVSSCRRATVLADWSPTCPSELELKQGEVVKVLKMSGGEEEEGWWDGITDDGRSGQFPSTYVELLPAIPGPPPGRPGGGGMGGAAAAQGGAEEKSTLGMGGGRGAGGRVRSMSRANFATPPVVKMKKVRLERLEMVATITEKEPRRSMVVVCVMCSAIGCIFDTLLMYVLFSSFFPTPVLQPSPSFPFVPLPSLCRLQHALGDIDAFDELLDNGFVVEAQVEGSGEQRPSEGNMVQVKVEAYVSI